ncbi:M14 family metallopeptidase [Aliikangiella sp. IMCC44653]
MKINSNFDGGNIQCVNIENPANIQLKINKDNNSEFYQWFYFRLTEAKGIECQLNIVNAKDSAYADGWNDYQAVASYDREYWFRVPTEYKEGVLSINHEPESDSVYYAYFAPYSTERCSDLVNWALTDSRVKLDILGNTLDGNEIEQLVIGDESSNKKKIWVHARQHPGETMASWWSEGFIQRLLDEDDAVSRALLERATFYIVPNLNPDGSQRGHLRTNAAGANLNREWLEPTMEKSPEVYLLREKMQKIGVDFNLDVHGDEALPYNFIAGAEGVANWTPQLESLQQQFETNYQRFNPDFQTKYGYPKDQPGEADLRICSNYITQTFNCLSLTLEMPFKDTADTPMPIQGWSPERSIKLGSTAVDVLWSVIDQI